MYNTTLDAELIREIKVLAARLCSLRGWISGRMICLKKPSGIYLKNTNPGIPWMYRMDELRIGALY
jgi:hypothetical protein